MISMKANFFFGIFFILIVATAVFAVAKPASHKGFALPNTAVEVSPGVYSLGKAFNNNGKLVEGYAIVRYKEGSARATGSAKGSASCYTFLSKGAKWKVVEPYSVDPSNAAGLNGSFVRSNLALDISKWEDAADGVVNGVITKNILGSEAAGIVDGADSVSPDGKNEVMFGPISDSGAIAVTIVWGIFSGPIGMRELVEWDQVYDDFDFAWSATGEASKMDFENIATHELGHSVGLGDIYNYACSVQTMFGYASEGETNKRTLESADIEGVKQLYK